ncbi:putative ribosomal n-lysine methyltransferase [Phaeomoniella chlamydospora]|uniref:Putative ribosomal n-lysine methyltransferase n=1 Tax=Phaeomoniella chlamydospora TaxID=158046 RepID=A0A0G2ERE7_PHACM|nr:putative ribosomal n-lysine methyltransferase [Phaeomoniella chlamydospora]
MKLVMKQRRKIEKDWKDVVESGIVREWEEELALYQQQQQHERSQATTTAASTIDSPELAPSITSLIPLEPKARFTYCWVIVNTRCFYYTPPLPPPFTSKTSPSDSSPNATLSSPFPGPDDNLALLPYLDLFNHTSTPLATSSSSIASRPCPSTFTPSSYILSSPSTGLLSSREIYTSYGPHPQDFLFAEYGFILPFQTNTAEYLELDEVIIRDVESLGETEEIKELIQELKDRGFWGEWCYWPPDDEDLQQERGHGNVCFRTQVLALLVAGRKLASRTTNGFQKTAGQDSTTIVLSSSQQSTDIDPKQAWLSYLNGELDLDFEPDDPEANTDTNSNPELDVDNDSNINSYSAMDIDIDIIPPNDNTDNTNEEDKDSSSQTQDPHTSNTLSSPPPLPPPLPTKAKPQTPTQTPCVLQSLKHTANLQITHWIQTLYHSRSHHILDILNSEIEIEIESHIPNISILRTRLARPSTRPMDTIQQHSKKNPKS